MGMVEASVAEPGPGGTTITTLMGRNPVQAYGSLG